jgi:exo-beta-1,3-glucanase (GH17 family)
MAMTVNNYLTFNKNNPNQLNSAAGSCETSTVTDLSSPATISGSPLTMYKKRVDTLMERVLMVDSDANHLQHTTDMLKMLGYECSVVGSSAEALDKFMIRLFRYYSDRSANSSHGWYGPVYTRQ